MKFRTNKCHWCKQKYIKKGHRLYCSHKCMKRAVDTRYEKRNPEVIKARKKRINKQRTLLVQLARQIGIKKLRQIIKSNQSKKPTRQ